jgi:hypothetical protein
VQSQTIEIIVVVEISAIGYTIVSEMSDHLNESFFNLFDRLFRIASQIQYIKAVGCIYDVVLISPLSPSPWKSKKRLRQAQLGGNEAQDKFRHRREGKKAKKRNFTKKTRHKKSKYKESRLTTIWVT